MLKVLQRIYWERSYNFSINFLVNLFILSLPVCNKSRYSEGSQASEGSPQLYSYFRWFSTNHQGILKKCFRYFNFYLEFQVSESDILSKSWCQASKRVLSSKHETFWSCQASPRLKIKSFKTSYKLLTFHYYSGKSEFILNNLEIFSMYEVRN